MNKKPRVRVAGILIKDEKILLIQHTKNNKNYWLLPGGGVDYGETFQEALRREFKEETNLEIEPKEMSFISESIAPDLRRHIINIYFKVEHINGELKKGDENNLVDLKYINLCEIKEITLYPNIKNELLELSENGIKYLGNRWE